MYYRELLRQFANRVFIGDALDTLRELPGDFFHVGVTSPPYYGLRDYGTRRWFPGNDPDCEHNDIKEYDPPHPGQVEQTKWRTAEAAGKGQTAITYSCIHCGAWYGQLGLEPSPETYILHLVEIFREVRRVLRPEGVLWLNIGDSYARGRTGRADGGRKEDDPSHWKQSIPEDHIDRSLPPGLKEKDLIGIPWMLAIALRKDGWYLRSETIWEKPNVMPESVRDRPTRSHEQVFLLTKSSHYFYDHEADREPVGDWVAKDPRYQEDAIEVRRQDEPSFNARLGKPITGLTRKPIASRNLRTIWKINPQPYRGAHFAVFPPALPERCIKLGTSEHGACATCGAPFERIVERVIPEAPRFEENVVPNNTPHQRFSWEQQRIRNENPSITKGWEQTCTCRSPEREPCVVLDPFAGSGTTLATAVELGRSYVGIELNEAYGQLINARLRGPKEEALERDLFERTFQLPNEFDLMHELDEDFGYDP